MRECVCVSLGGLGSHSDQDWQIKSEDFLSPRVAPKTDSVCIKCISSFCRILKLIFIHTKILQNSS